MITVRRTVAVNVAIDRVAPYLSDFATTERWDPHTARCTRLDDGPIRVGSTFENVQKVGPFRPRFTYRVEQYEPERLVRLHSQTRSLDATDTMEFEERDGPRGSRQTVVTYTASFDLKGAARALAPAFEKFLNRVADDGAAGLRATLTAELAH